MNPHHHCFQLGDIQTNRGQTGPLDHIERPGSVITGSVIHEVILKHHGNAECANPKNIRKKTNYWRTRQPAFLSEYLLMIVRFESDASILVLFLSILPPFGCFDMSVVYYY
jgi:hypothetical protein